MCNNVLPTRTEIESYANAFRLVNERTESELYGLFSQPATRDIVEKRVERLNAIYGTRISEEDRAILVDRILNRNIESEAKKNSINAELVSDLARVGNGLSKNALSFASKYFSFCNPDVYPLFDNNVMGYLWEMNEAFHFDDNFYQTEVNAIRRNVDYARFIEIWSAFRNLSDDLRSVSVNDLDKYMWIKGSN